MVISIDQGSYLLLPIISGIKEHEKCLFSCASWNCLNPLPKINRFVAWLAKRTLFVAFALVLHPYCIMSSVVHTGNNPKQLQIIQAFHKRWHTLPSRHSGRWIFATTSSEFMSSRCCKAQTDTQIRVRQLPLTQTTLTNPIVLVWRSSWTHWPHYHQLIDEFLGCRRRTFTNVVGRHLVNQQQQDYDVLAAAPS